MDYILHKDDGGLYLCHYGRKGMHWGQHIFDTSRGTATEAARYARTMTKLATRNAKRSAKSNADRILRKSSQKYRVAAEAKDRAREEAIARRTQQNLAEQKSHRLNYAKKKIKRAVKDASYRRKASKSGMSYSEYMKPKQYDFRASAQARTASYANRRSRSTNNDYSSRSRARNFYTDRKQAAQRGIERQVGKATIRAAKKIAKKKLNNYVSRW